MLNCPIIIAKQQRSISHFGLAPINHFHKFSNCKKSKFQISVEGGVGVKKKARSGTDQYSDFRLDPDSYKTNTVPVQIRYTGFRIGIRILLYL